MSRMFTLLRMGIPIEALVKVITFSGFLEGRWTVDVAKLLEMCKLRFMLMLIDIDIILLLCVATVALPVKK